MQALKMFQLILMIAATVLLPACENEGGTNEINGDKAAAGTNRREVYVAQFGAINEELTGPIDGTARITIDGDQVTFKVEVDGVPASISHMQHTHGKPDVVATCPRPEADTNQDGVIDLIEAEQTTGTTMIPFHGKPTSMAIKAETYPTASDDGSYSYEQTVDLTELREAFEQKFPGQEFRWKERIVMIHGVAADADLPDTAQSLSDVPSHVTLPIACGPLRKDH